MEINEFLKVCIKNRTCYYFDDIIKFKDFDSDNILLDKKSQCQSFKVISIHYLFVFKNKHCLHVYLDNCAYNIVDKQMKDYLGDSLSETD